MRNTAPSAYTAVPTSMTARIGHVHRNHRSRSRNQRSRWTGILTRYPPSLLTALERQFDSGRHYTTTTQTLMDYLGLS
ncbi:hypothetical protein Cenrod_2664 [Candidatus Symbiobacter mobilis CR]|uniref:Uncharacterized protein n=1 Tax=Candidatus Symbiobacter mobilis CR TaxID=946483 RepID=U5NEX2_9BURK|nr:hypothetical protein Cenrod_2664 [Candidatus Symbiobacter mobilis CR]